MTPPVLVACLCAQWCGVCGEYRVAFDQVARELGAARFVWIDIEDEAELVDPVEVDDFPTVLIAVGGEPRFFGSVIPNPQTLSRLVRAQIDASVPGGSPDPDLRALVARIEARPA